MINGRARVVVHRAMGAGRLAVLARSHRQSTAAKMRADKAEGAARVIRWSQRRCKGFVLKAFCLWNGTAEAITLRDRITTECDEEMEKMQTEASERVEAIRTRLQATEVRLKNYKNPS
jgi:hypothetical protein